MNVPRLLALYERAIDAPDAIARLRRFVLDLAVRGRLVRQDPKDDPVSTILRKQKKTFYLDGPFELPQSWVWVNVGEIGEARLGKMLDKAKNKGVPRPYLRNVNVRWFDFDLSDVLKMPFEDSELAEFTLRIGDVLICEGGEPGRAAVWDERERDIYFQKAIHRLRFSGLVDSAYFVKTLRASADDGRLSKSFTGTGIKHFTGKGLDAYRFPLPPLAEQRRIVAKADELIALCDRLEAMRSRAEAKRKRLIAVSLNRLSATNLATFVKDSRFVLDNLESLTARNDQIKHLRQSILNLAVRGKLVPQDPSDEPASTLLTTIRRKRQELIRGGALKPGKKLSLIKENEAPFSVPSSWAWVLANEIWDFENGDRSKNYPSRDQLVTSGIPFVNAGHLVDGRVLLREMNFITREKFDGLGSGKVRKGDQLYCLRGSLGKHAVYDHDDDAAIASSLVILRPVESLCVPYLSVYLDSDVAARMLGRFDNGSAQPNLSSANLRRYEIPLPPLVEQQRIMAKINELMALCDRLEVAIANRSGIRRQLLDALLHEALSREETASVETL